MANVGVSSSAATNLIRGRPLWVETRPRHSRSHNFEIDSFHRVNRHLIVNTTVAAMIVVLIAAVFVAESRGNDTAATTTTSTSTTVPSTTSTTTSVPATTTSTTSTTTSTTSTTSTVPPTTLPPLPRELWKVIVVNGTSGGELLEPAVDQLEDLGYVNVRGLVGAVQASETVIYYLLPGQESAAERMRSDLELLDARIASFADAPPVAGRNDAQLMLYLGGS